MTTSRKSGEAKTPTGARFGSSTQRVTASSALVAYNAHRGKVRRVSADQLEAQLMFEAVGEVRKAVTSRGALLSGCTFTIGLRPLPDDDEGRPLYAEDGSKLDPSISDTMIAVAEQALANIVDVRGSQATLIDAQSQNWDVTGEAYLAGWWVNGKGDAVEESSPDAERQRWEVFGSGAYRVEGTRCYVRLSRDGTEIRLPDSAYVVRTWKRHPVWPDEAHGWVMSALPSCRSLLAYSLAERSQALSSAVGTIHLVPADAAPAQPMVDGLELYDEFNGPDTVGGKTAADLWAEKLDADIAGVVAEVLDDWQSGRAVQGGVLAIESKFIEHFGKTIDIGRTIDTGLGEQTERALQRLKEQADCSPEMISGLGDTNRWNGKQIDESDYRRYHRPQIEAIAESWTADVIWPALRAAGFSLEDTRKLIIVVNKLAIVAPPDRSKIAGEALRNGAIGWEGYRKLCDIPDRYAPQDGELEALVAFYAATRTSTRGGTGDGSEAPDEVNPVNDAVAAIAPVSPLRVVASVNQTPLALQLLDVERSTRDALAAAGAVAFDMSLSRVHSKMRNLARKHLRHEVPAGVSDVLGHLGPERSRAVLAAEYGDDEDRMNEELLLAALLAFKSRFEDIGRGFFGRALRVLGMDMPTSRRPAVSPFTRARMTLDDIVSAIEDGWETLSDSVRIWITEHLDGRGSAIIPDSIWRKVLDAFGGAHPTPGTGPVVTPSDPPGPTAGVFGDLFAPLEPDVEELQWVHNPVKPEAFRPHMALNGIVVTGPEDPILSGAPWGSYWPGDHKGCMCDVVPVFDESAIIEGVTA